MSKLKSGLGGLWLVTMMVACAPAEQGASLQAALIGAPGGPLVAEVNGEAITEPLLTIYARGHGFDLAQPDQRERALDSLIENVLLAQDAAATGLLEQSEVQAELALVRLQQLAGRQISQQRNAITIDDAQVQQVYEQERARAGDTEWRIEHMLFAEQATAQAMLTEALQPGADFARLMQNAPGRGARQAKDLGWSNATQVPAEIVAALKQLEDGEIAPLPVPTSFGFHVVRRAASRPFVPPPIETVKEGARRQIIDTALRDYVAGLRAKAVIHRGASAPQG